MIIKKSDGRLWEIDLLRGIAILLMIIFHFIYDLNHLQIIYYKLWQGPFDYASKIIASIFFILVGISLTLSFNKNQQIPISQRRMKFIHRGVKLLLLGMIITLISWMIIPERFVIFGVLHCIGVSIILSLPFISYIRINMIIGTFLILFGLFLHMITVDFLWLIPFGVIPPNFFMIDFFPLFPWFGIVLIGISIGNYLYPNAQRKFHLPPMINHGISQKICFIGRHSLYIYFLHQPILFGFIFLFLY